MNWLKRLLGAKRKRQTIIGKAIIYVSLSSVVHADGPWLHFKSFNKVFCLYRSESGHWETIRRLYGEWRDWDIRDRIIFEEHSGQKSVEYAIDWHDDYMGWLNPQKAKA
jgi:hypothetical protein